MITLPSMSIFAFYSKGDDLSPGLNNLAQILVHEGL